jgi:hypothetical protein
MVVTLHHVRYRSSSTPDVQLARSSRELNRIFRLAVAEYEHLYRIEIDDLAILAREAEHYRQIFNHIRPNQTLSRHRPIASTPTRRCI